MASTEDFSFPTTTDTPLRFVESPPLWHRSSSTPSRLEEPGRKAPEGDDKEGENSPTTKPINNKQRKSFSYVERGGKAVREDAGDDKEEKMDMLWEDFNEEVSKNIGSGLEYSDMSPGRVADFGCVQALNWSKNSGKVFSSKKPSVVVFMRVLKKLFLLHNSQRSLKR